VSDTSIVRPEVVRATAAAIVLVAVILFVSPTVAHDGHWDEDSTFGVLYISLFFIAAAVALVIIFRIQRGARNRHTGLPRPIKRRRVRGPLKNGRLN
jgi:protein-S-isoprenylcysteine O-methyltransferase Ste14